MEIGILARRPGRVTRRSATICAIFVSSSTQISKRKIGFEFGPSTCKAPYQQLQESGEGAFVTPLYSNPRCASPFHQNFFRNIAVENHQIISSCHGIKISSRKAVIEVWVTVLSAQMPAPFFDKLKAQGIRKLCHERMFVLH